MNDSQREIYNYIGRHIVSLRGISREANSVVDTPFNFSGFVVSIRSDWFLFTAGHIINRIIDARRANMDVESFRLDDAYRPDAPYKEIDELTPFDFDNAPKYFIDQPELGDYAAIWLRQNYRDLLSKNKIEPFSRREIAKITDGTGFLFHWLIGLPEELMSIHGQETAARHRSQLVTIQLKPLTFSDLPDRIKLIIKENGYRKDNFFAQIPDAIELSIDDEIGLQNILGMSGGPIIGWRRDIKGVLGYSLIAIQSIWWKESRILMACPAIRFVNALDKTIQATRV